VLSDYQNEIIDDFDRRVDRSMRSVHRVRQRPPASSYSANSYSPSPAHKELVDVFHRAELRPDSRERSQLSLDRVASLTRRRLSATWAKFTERWR
jgi:hypothetical protein